MEIPTSVTTPMMIAAWVTGSVLISKANFMPPSDRDLSKNKEELEEEGGEGAPTKGRNPGTVPTVESYGNGTSMVLDEGLS